jgi:hypothetical protein
MSRLPMDASVFGTFGQGPVEQTLSLLSRSHKLNRGRRPHVNHCLCAFSVPLDRYLSGSAFSQRRFARRHLVYARTIMTSGLLSSANIEALASCAPR